MTAIDCTDCFLAIEIGDGVKRALVRHFSRFIGARLAALELACRDDAAADKLDREAWRLAARVLSEVEAEIEGALDENLLAPDPQKSAQEILANAVDASVAAIEQHYLADNLLGFDALCAKLRAGGFGALPPSSL
ncbi:MAG TPA: hypothetical protein VGL83_07200 [Stellaceae bacterium]|jgi:hypothetical protein